MKNIPMHVKMTGEDPSAEIAGYTAAVEATVLVLDFLPLREKMQWDEAVVHKLKANTKATSPSVFVVIQLCGLKA
jgi:hypothetical protein